MVEYIEEEISKKDIMSNRKQKKKSLNLTLSPIRICAFVGVVAILLVSLLFSAQIEKTLFGASGDSGSWSYTTGTLAIHFVDVGQGDCSIIQLPDGKIAIIDGGKPNQYSTLDAYIKKLRGNNKTIDYVILTHPHDDHYGGLIGIFQNYNVKTFYRPPEHSANIWHLFSKTGESFAPIVEPNYLFYFYSTSNYYSDLNEYSPIIEFKAFSQTFYFTGDAGKTSEDEFLAQGGGAVSSILQVGHHGSKHSSTQNFLNAINPSYAIISVGKNSYGHPTQDTISRLQNVGSTIYRTDINGNVVFAINGTGALLVFSDYYTNQVKWSYIVYGLIVVCGVLFFTKMHTV